MSKVAKCLAGLSLILFIFVCGCGPQKSMTANSEITIRFETSSSKDVHVTDVRAYYENDELVIKGKVKRGLRNCCESAKGHVDIVILDSERNILDSISTLYSPRNIPKSRTRTSRFSARRPYALPEGAIVRVTYHASLDDVGKEAYAAGAMFFCEHSTSISL